MLKILSWNIQAGGGSRIRSIVRAIVNSKSEIIGLSEFRNNDAGTQIRHLLLQHGYRFQAVAAAERNANSVLIAAKMPFDTELHPNSDKQFAHNIISAHFSAFSFMSVYLPHKKKHQLLPYIKEHATASNKPYIIAGDYNTGKNFVDQKGDSFWYTAELAALEKAGFVDAYRLIHGEKKDFSWYSHQGNGFRYDHTYVEKLLEPIVKDCYYLHQFREEKLSDHSAMILTLGVQ